MLFHRLFEFVRKDLKLFALDRQALVLALLVPVMVATILGWMDVTSSSDGSPHPIAFDFVDQDGSSLSKDVLARLQKDTSVKPVVADLAFATNDVRSGGIAAVLVVPAGFGASAAGAFSGGTKPTLRLIADPSKDLESRVVKGVVLQLVSGAVAESQFGALAKAGAGLVDVQTETAVANAKAAKWAGAAHEFAGFGMQGLLFFAMEAAVGLARERKLGMWLRLRSSPMPPWIVLLAKGVSSALLALGIIVGMFSFGALLFGIRILGSALGFVSVCTATALVAASFGLLIATLCKSEAQSRGVAFLLIMLMLATGGAWFPMAKMPAFVQTFSRWLPVRWAVEGFDAMTWRGEGLANALHTTGVLTGFAVAFALLAAFKFRADTARA